LRNDCFPSRKEDLRMDDRGGITERCLELHRRGDFVRAEELAREGLREDPENGTLWQLDGLMRRGRGDFDGARDALETASLLVPLNAV
jgi:Flp pilus assembly protein TadD